MLALGCLLARMQSNQFFSWTRMSSVRFEAVQGYRIDLVRERPLGNQGQTVALVARFDRRLVAVDDEAGAVGVDACWKRP